MPNFNGRETAAEVNLVLGLRVRVARLSGGGGDCVGTQAEEEEEEEEEMIKESRLRGGESEESNRIKCRIKVHRGQVHSHWVFSSMWDQMAPRA